MKRIISIALILTICLSTLTYAGTFDLGLSMLGIDTNKIVGYTNDKVYYEDPYGRIDSVVIVPTGEDSGSEKVTFNWGDVWQQCGENLYYRIPYKQQTTLRNAIKVEEYREYEQGVASYISTHLVEAGVLPMFFELIKNCVIENGKIIRN